MLLENFAENKKPKILFFSGAGISVDSGVPTFRADNGLWLEHNVEEVCNIKNFDKHYEKTLNFYDSLRFSLADKHYNQAHKFIAEMQMEFGSDTVGVVTTNVDEFFEEAGVKEVMHLHGNIMEMIVDYKTPSERCVRSGYEPFNYSSVKGKCKPNVVFFEESSFYEEGYKKEIYHDFFWILHELNESSLVFILGASNQVVPMNYYMSGSKAKYYNINPISFNEKNDTPIKFPHEIISSSTDAIPIMRELIEKHLKG